MDWERKRLSGFDYYPVPDIFCAVCETIILENGYAATPIYYKHTDGTTVCPMCRGDYDDYINETQSGGLGI